MLISIIFFVVGLYLLVKGADWLVDGSASIARRFGLSELFIGLTIVAFGTSMPELVVNLVSVFGGTPEVAIGNIVGSNVANIFLILGVAAIIAPLRVQSSTVWKEIPFSLLGAAAVLFLGFDAVLGGKESALTLGDGLMFISIFAVYMWYLIGMARADASAKGDSDDAASSTKFSMGAAVLATLGGLVLLIVGGKLAVDAAIDIALAIGMSTSVVALTVVAVGTSLPEMATSIVAARKGQDDIAVGNVVGSNIFNVFWILGISSVVGTLPFSTGEFVPVLAATFASLALFAFCFVGKRHTIDRWQGWAFIAVYTAYVMYLLV